MIRISIKMVFIAMLFAACNNNAPKETTTAIDSAKNNLPSPDSVAKKPVLADELITAYLQLKNALINDNGKDAAVAAGDLGNALAKMDETSMSAEQKKIFDDVKDDLKEHAEHINTNGNLIAHQREHFNWLSDAMYPVVKAFSTGKALYKDHCPMYDDGKGANWISEFKEIKNPYYGSKMVKCGSVIEEIK
jgi:hypothetical protein